MWDDGQKWLLVIQSGIRKYYNEAKECGDMMGSYVLGVDLGGTNVRAVLLDESGQLLAFLNEPTKAQDGPSAVIDQIAGLAHSVVEKAGVAFGQVQGLGIGLPGVIDSENGIAVTLPNLPGWRNIPLARQLQDSLGVQVYCENDARMAAWGEKLLGAGRDYHDLICLTIGTGIGSGIFLSGKLWRGHLGSAGEIGHMTVEKEGLLCSCGNKGCLEMYASGRGIARRSRLAASEESTSIISQYSNEQVTARTVYEAAITGDKAALRIMLETAEYLGLAIANLANILNPELIILGGGVSEGWGELLIRPVKEVVVRRAMSLNKQVTILQAQLGERAGVLGAAEMARLKYLKRQDLSIMFC